MKSAARPARRTILAMSDTITTINDLLKQADDISSSDWRRALEITRRALNLARSIDDDYRIARCYRLLGMGSRSLQRLAHGLQYLLKALKLLERMAVNREVNAEKAVVCYEIGRVFDSKGDFPPALDYFRRALEFSEAVSDRKYTIATLAVMGDIQRQLGDLELAITLLTRSLKLSLEIDDPRGMGISYNNIGIVHTEVWDWEKAVESFREALKYARQAGDRRTELAALANLGQCYVEMKDPGRAIDALTRAAEMTDEMGLLPERNSVLLHLASLHVERGEIEQASICYAQAVEILDRIDSPVRRVSTLRAVCSFYARTDRSVLAIPYGVQALELARSLALRPEESLLCFILAKVYEAVSDAENAMLYYAQHNKLDLILRKQKTRRVIAARDLRAELERVEQEKEELQLKMTAMAREAEHQSKELAATALRLTQRDEIIKDAREGVMSLERQNADDRTSSLRILIQLLQDSKGNDGGWSVFERQFQALHPGFIHLLIVKYPTLTSVELKICSLLRVGMASKDIANVLAISINTVNTHRFNIRTKLHLPNKSNLPTFLAAIE